MKKTIVLMLSMIAVVAACSKMDVAVQPEEEMPVSENKQEVAVPQIMTKAAVDVASCRFDFYKPGDGTSGVFAAAESLGATYSEKESKWIWAGASSVSTGVTKMVAMLHPDAFNGYWGWDVLWIKDLYEGADTYTKSVYDNGVMVGVADFDHTSTNTIKVYQALAKLQITLDESCDFPIQTDFYMVKDGCVKINEFSSDTPIDISGQSKKWHIYTSKYDKTDVLDVKNSICFPIVPQTFDATAALFEYTKSNNKFSNSAYPDYDAAPVRYSYTLKQEIEVKKNRALRLTSEDLDMKETIYELKLSKEVSETRNGTDDMSLAYDDYFAGLEVNDVIRLKMKAEETGWMNPAFAVNNYWYELPDYKWNAGFNANAGDVKGLDIVVNSDLYARLARTDDGGNHVATFVARGNMTPVSIEIWTPKATE